MPNALSNYTNQDHPHIHGEYVYLDNLEAGDIGSPPHTWGILQLISARSIQLGITPTYMGNTFIFHQLPDTNEDHPHIHGEYQFKKRLVKTAMGSPPHTWGIPARLVWVATRAQDHPHIHGEYQLIDWDADGEPGSPPHTWGIHLVPGRSGLGQGITPTYMGNTRCN